MADDLIVPVIEKSSRPQPQSIQQAPPYIVRQPLYITNPTLFTPAQWRFVAKEPITRMCIRYILRELGALEYAITSDYPDRDADLIAHNEWVLDQADDGEGFDISLSRGIQDALCLPIGGNWERQFDEDGHVVAMWSIDGATMYPTYDLDVPFVQINPYNGLDRMYFGRGDIARLIFQPRVELDKKAYQEAPVESAFLAIEALSRIYLYYLKQLGDTPAAGILDLMDFNESEAVEWAKGFRELLEGIDPLKIPILYDHTKPARFLPFSRTPQDLNIVENFKRFAELVSGQFGLSIGDLRLFEHERVLAGVEASQRVTARSGVGYYAQTIEDFINRYILFTTYTGVKLKYKLGMTGEEQMEAQLANARVQVLNSMIQQQYLKHSDAQKQVADWKILTIKPTGLPAGAGGIGGLLGAGKAEEVEDAGPRLGDKGQDTVGKIHRVIDPASGVEFARDEIAKLAGRDYHVESIERAADEIRRLQQVFRLS